MFSSTKYHFNQWELYNYNSGSWWCFRKVQKNKQNWVIPWCSLIFQHLQGSTVMSPPKKNKVLSLFTNPRWSYQIPLHMHTTGPPSQCISHQDAFDLSANSWFCFGFFFCRSREPGGFRRTWMSRWKLGSMVRIHGLFHLYTYKWDILGL